MTGFFIIVLVLLLTSLASASIVQEKYRSSAYSAYGYLGFDGCSSLGGYYYYGYYSDSSLNVNVYSAQTNFQLTPGKSGYKSTNEYDDLYVSFDLYSCDSDTLTYKYGSVYESSYYGPSDPSKFTIESKKLTEATLMNVQVPVFEQTCSIECTEFCFPEIFGYGECPPEETDLECYPKDCDVELIGTADIDFVWKAASGTNTPLEQGSSTYTSRSKSDVYTSRSKGSYRYDVSFIVTAMIDGSNLFPTSTSYSSGQLSSSTSNEVVKTKNNRRLL